MSSTEINKKSKVVFLRRAPISLPESMAENGKDAEVKAYFDNSYRALGAYWPKDSMRPGTGLTLTEENFLMPYILNIPKEDRDFRQKSTDYFHEINIRVEPTNLNDEGGTKLEIGLNDNKKELSPDNLPLNITDYVKYRLAISHPYVAMSKEESRGDRTKQYYIHDPAAVVKGRVSKADSKDLALEAYLEVKAKASSVRQYLTLLNEDPSRYAGMETVKLREFAEIDPGAFLKVHNDENKNARYLIKQLVFANVLEQVGTRYLTKEGKQQIGRDMDDAIAYVKDPINSEQVSIFKGQVQDWQKTKTAAGPSLQDIE